MLSLSDVKTFLQSESTQFIEILGMDTDTPERATSYKISGGSNVSSTMKQVDLSITTRASHPKYSEQDCYEWYQKLNGKTNFNIGNSNVILARSITVPSYLGQFENGLFYFTISFSILMEVQ